MSASQWQTQVVPAQLAFLAIYNPSLGPTDETFSDQLVYYYSRAAHDARTAARKNARDDAAGGDAARAEENEKLRHIGLAQGMVDFARGFSEGMPVDSVDTEKSRIILHELERGWWILASIDLTKLPVLAQTSNESTKSTSGKADSTPNVEYSSREVSPPALLLQQLLQAHYIFTLHHGPSLSELFVRTSREKFCSTLDRFWNRFSRSWDVLLHGNPAIDVFGAVKLASGGELGMGVGEEEWGSGEREVLEDLARRTEGLVDLVVSRFGEPAPTDNDSSTAEAEALPWIGTGSSPAASDGLIFGGVGNISRRSLRNISLWMRQIYSFGDYAYGVRDNPTRDRPRRRRREARARETDIDSVRSARAQTSRTRPKASTDSEAESSRSRQRPKERNVKTSDQTLTKLSPNSQHTRTSDRSTTHPGIPPPIVTAVERSLERATKGADIASNSSQNGEDTEEAGTTLGIPDQYMKYLTFGLSTLAKPSKQRTSETPSQHPTAGQSGLGDDQQSKALEAAKPLDPSDADEGRPRMKSIDPVPDGEELEIKVATQKRYETLGHFIIGLKGDLNDIPEQSDDGTVDATQLDDFDGTRTVLRTLQIELSQAMGDDVQDQASSGQKRAEAGHAPINIALKHYRRLRVLIYAHRPFLYCFLFENRTPSLSMARFYNELHRNLLPIHKPLLSSTSLTKVTQRLEEANVSATASDNSSVASSNKPTSKLSKPNPIYDLIYDPTLLTVHTTIPNIPEPGTPAAEGIFTSVLKVDRLPSWTRVEALNVHSQILNTLVSTQRSQHEYERTSKTSRGWWVVWLKLPPLLKSNGQSEFPSRQSPSQSPDRKATITRLNSMDSSETVVPSTHMATSTKLIPQMNRIAFLVRKASDSAPAKSTTHNRAVSASTSLWNALSLQSSTASGDAANASPTVDLAPSILPGGMGFDARKYIEGLLSLNR